MKKLFFALTFLLCLSSVVICGMLYIKTEETNQLCRDILSLYEAQQDTVPASAPRTVPPVSARPEKAAEETVTVQILADEVTDLYAYQFELHYDESALSCKSVRSSIPGIDMIFQKPSNGYLIVGATKVGDLPGFSGENLVVCELTMTTLKEGELPGISINNLDLIDSSMQIKEDANNWSCEIVA